MIQVGTFVKVIDNSGAKLGFCIRILNSGYNQRYAKIGSTILVSIKALRSVKNLKVKKGDIHKAVVIKTKSKIKTFSYNNIINALIKDQLNWTCFYLFNNY